MDPTLKEINIKRSLRKFWLDSLSSDVSIYFDRIITSPTESDHDRWISILIYGTKPAHVSEVDMNIYIFSRNDDEGDKLSQLRDAVLEVLFPATIDIFDTEKDPWEKIGGFHVAIDSQSQVAYNPDKSKMIYIITTLRWGAVWS